MNETFEQCLSMQSGKNKSQRSPIQVKFVTQRSFQATKQTHCDNEQQRLVFDYQRQGLTNFNDGMIWNGLLHLILNENKIKEFDTNILKKTPLLQNLSLEDNQLEIFGPIEYNDIPQLSTLNLARNLLKQIDPSICKLHLKKLYIQQNQFTNITKQIMDLSYTLEVLGLGWGIFCQSQFDFLLEDQKLKVFFTLMEAMSNELTFEQYIMNYKSISNAIIVTQGDILNDSINSQNEQLLTQIKEYLNYHSLEIETQLNYMNDYKQNLMHLAVIYDEIGILDYLLNHHLDLANQIDLKGHTPLSLAIEKKYYRLVSLILNFNINVNIGGGLQSSNLHITAQQCQVELLKDLIDLGANPAQYDIFKDTPLHVVSSYNDHKRVKQFYQVILQQPFDVNHYNLKGQTCLEILIEKNNFLTLQFCSEWNTTQIRQFNEENLFNFCSINPHTKLSLLDKSILTKSLMIQSFLIDFQLVPITYQTLMLCFFPKIRNIFLYKILKKQQLIQIRNTLILQDYNNLNEDTDRIPNISSPIKAIEKLNLSDENNSYDDDQMSNISDNAPGQVSENLKQLNNWTPKFQCIRNVNVNLKKSFYDILSNITECIPDDEISLIHLNKDIINNGNKLVTKKNMDQIYTSRLEHKLSRGNKQNLKQHNYSPNNIRMIENRNSIFKYDNYHQKRQLAILQKQMRQIIINLQNYLRESNQQNKEVIGQYFKTQFHILDQFLTSKIGKELIIIDKPLQTEIRTLRTLIEQDRFKPKTINQIIDLFDLLK